MIPAEFFAAVRPMFGGRLSQEQVDGLSVLVEEGLRRDLTDPQLAYVLATAFHETARTMQPIDEYGGDAYFRRMYDIEGANPRRAKTLGNVNPGDGARYHGRGYVQITGRANYRKFGERYGIDLEGTPVLAKNPVTAARIIFDGMMEGGFTGRALPTYVNADRKNYYNARAVVNGDKRKNGKMIADTARKFEAALAYVDVPPVPKPRPVVDHGPAANDAQPPSPSKGEPQGWLAIIIALLKRIFGKG